MKRQLSFQQYRAIDLVLFGLILVVSESLIVKAANFWFADQLYTVSVVAALCAIVFMRWGVWGGIHAFIGGVVFCLASRGTARQLLIYSIGNLLSLLALIPLRSLGGEKIRKDGFLSVGFGLLVLILMQLGRAIMALVLGTSFRACFGFFATDALSALFTGLILWIARRLDGIFENQKHYLLRLHKEEDKGGY